MKTLQTSEQLYVTALYTLQWSVVSESMMVDDEKDDKNCRHIQWKFSSADQLCEGVACVTTLAAVSQLQCHNAVCECELASHCVEQRWCSNVTTVVMMVMMVMMRRLATFVKRRNVWHSSYDRRQPRLVKLSLLFAFLSFAYLRICLLYVFHLHICVLPITLQILYMDN